MKKIETFAQLLKLPVRTMVCLHRSDGDGFSIISPDHVAYNWPLFRSKDEDGSVYMQCHFANSIQQGEIFRLYESDFSKYQLFVMESQDIAANELAQYLRDQKPVGWVSRTITKIFFNFLFKLKARIVGAESQN